MRFLICNTVIRPDITCRAFNHHGVIKMKKDATCVAIRYLVTLMLFIFPMTISWASVTIIGSRIIYPSTAPSVDVQLKNNDAFPYIVQTWFDDGDIDLKPENASTIPFISTPPVFRILPKSGQIVRIVYGANKSLPQDRESLFWFNALQVPPANIGGEKQNKVLVMLRTRIKLFYRPEQIGSPDNLVKKLHVTMFRDTKKGIGITVDNPNPWFASMSNLSVTLNGTTHQLDIEMISPFSHHTFWLPHKLNLKSLRGTVTVTLINDQGARISEHYHVNEG